MTETTPIEAPRLYPTLRCRDAEAMIRWLKEAFGFTERVVYRGDGVVHHAELAFGSSILMLGQDRADHYGTLAGDLGGRRTARSMSRWPTRTRCMTGRRPRGHGSRSRCTIPTT